MRAARSRRRWWLTRELDSASAGGDVAHGGRLRQAGQHDAQAGRVAQQVEQVGEFVDAVVDRGWDAHLNM
jgi:hypothetical protein